MKNKNHKSKFSTTSLAIIILSILLIATVSIGITLAYFSSGKDKMENFSLYDPVTISITQGGSSVSSLTFSSDIMPGTIHTREIAVCTPANTSNTLIRAKLTTSSFNGSTKNVHARTTSDWILHSDNYYYYKGVLSENKFIAFIENIIIPSSPINPETNKTFNIDVVVESIQQDGNVANIVWTSAPTEWLTNYSNNQ